MLPADRAVFGPAEPKALSAILDRFVKTLSRPWMRAALAGNPDVTIKVLPGLNHLLQPAETGLPSEYGRIEITIAPRVLDLVSEWIDAHTSIAGRAQ